MARNLTYDIYNFEQEEIRETRQVAGPDGVITEESVLIQPHILIKAELLLTLDEYKEQNYTKIRYRIRYSISSNTEDIPENTYSILTNYQGSLQKPSIEITDEFGKEFGGNLTSNTTRLYATYGTESKVFYIEGDTAETYHTYYHRLNGKRPLSFKARVLLQPSGIETLTTSTINRTKTIDALLDYDRSTTPITADNFTDEENASFTYQTVTGKSIIEYKSGYTSNMTDSITGLQAALSFDGVTPDIPYRDIDIDGTSYTFNFTDEERETLRIKAQGGTAVPIYYLTKTTRFVQYTSTGYKETVELVGATERIITIVGAYPSINPTVKDIKPETLALTGNENTFIRHESMAEFAINAVASKHATIIEQSVQCGSKTVTNMPYGVIDDVESGNFNFYALDSRNMAVAGTVYKNLVEYVKPTCTQKVEIALTGETSASVKLTVSGSYFGGSFGAVNNAFTYQVRHTDDAGNMGEWFTVNIKPTLQESLYELECLLTGFDYGRAYTFQSRIIDSLNTAQSAQYTIRYLPVFDWGENDFNFNVPVNIANDTLGMHGNTVLRFNKDAKNTVLSGGGGRIYLRPSGTDATEGETIFYPNGNVDFGGAVNFASDGFTIDGNKIADYITAQGTEEMGSNGTWYWVKWASGKAECWGCRNFGNMAVTTTWGGLYRSAILTQTLPTNLFKTTPDVLNINIVNSNYGGWICKHENTAPSAVTTGSFIFVRPASATVSPTYIGFHIIGISK